MNWLNDILGTDLPSGAQLAILFVALLVLLLLAVWLLRKIFSNKVNTSNRSRQPRLTVTDAAIVDDKRRLVLVRRDNVEHLVMIGGPSDIVIEQNIHHTAPVQTVHDDTAHATAIIPETAAPAVEEKRQAPSHKPAEPKKQEPIIAPVAASTRNRIETPVEPAKPAPEVDLSADRPVAASAVPAKTAAPVENLSVTPPPAAPKPTNATNEPAPKLPPRKDDMAESLEEMLATDTGAPKTAPAKPAPETTSPELVAKSSVDDDMQKLLKELELETSRG